MSDTVRYILIVYLIGILVDMIYLSIFSYIKRDKVDFLGVTCLSLLWFLEIPYIVLTIIANIISIFSKLIKWTSTVISLIASTVRTIYLNITGFIYLIITTIGVMFHIIDPEDVVNRWTQEINEEEGNDNGNENEQK
jgi:hypothetical protein